MRARVRPIIVEPKAGLLHNRSRALRDIRQHIEERAHALAPKNDAAGVGVGFDRVVDG